MTDKAYKERLEKLRLFYEDKKNWRPPSYAQIAKYMGYKTKGGAYQAVKNLYEKEKTKDDKLAQGESLETV